MSMRIAKSGWLYRQSSVLKKWKLKWLVLSQDGYLRYFEVENGSRAEGAVLMPVECTVIKTANEVTNVRAPEGLSERFLLSIETASGNKWVLCADSEDDMRAWQLALDQARLMTHLVRPASAPPGAVSVFHPPTSYTVVDDLSSRYVYGWPVRSVTYTYPGYTYLGYGPMSSPFVHIPRETVIYRRSPYSGYTGTNMALGMVAGAAIGSMLFTPLLFWC